MALTELGKAFAGLGAAIRDVGKSTQAFSKAAVDMERAMNKQLEKPMMCKLMVQLGEDVMEIDGVGANLAIDHAADPNAHSSFTLTGMILKSKTHQIAVGNIVGPTTDHRAVEGGFEFERNGKTRFVSQDAVIKYGMTAAADLAFTLEDEGDPDPDEETAFIKSRLEQGFTEIPGIPEHIRDGIKGYVIGRTPNGDFLTAVFANDLADAVPRADTLSFGALREIMQLIHMFTPDACHGSRDKVKAWTGR